MAKVPQALAWQHSHVLLTRTFLGVVAVMCLYWAQVVFIPLALAVFFAFLLGPLVLACQRRGLGRITSLTLVISVAALLMLGTGWLVSVQIANLYRELPAHAKNAYLKSDDLREFGLRAVADQIDPMVLEVTGVPKSTQEEPVRDGTGASAGGAALGKNKGGARPSESPERISWMSWLPGVITPVLGPFGSVGVAIVLAIFMLVKRGDLRDRFIRLLGRGRMAVTTKAVDEASGRISRYLLMQLIVNGSYGIAWGLGLAVIGVDHALLWGFLAALLRYVPYIGAPIGALLPVFLSFIQFEGWLEPLLVGGYLLVLELVSNNVIEPWLYGQSIGVSEVALLIAAAFWAFLWGPIGLVLSGPLTVCLVVLGRYVPQLEFFEVLLGDEPALEPHMGYHQRLLARDQDDAAQVAQAYAAKEGSDRVFDDVFIPALTYAKRDRERDSIDEEDEKFILRANREIVEDVVEQQTAKTNKSADASKTPEPRVHLLACPAEDGFDEVALEMMRQMLDMERWEVEVVQIATLASELLERIEAERPAILCIGSLPPGGLAHTRYLCKRIRARFPDLKIVVGRWGLKGNVEENREQLREAGANQVDTTLAETVAHLESWLPVFAQAKSPASIKATLATASQAN